MGKLTFGATGLSYQCDKVEVKVDGAPKCPRCQERVYFNEEKKAMGKTWHTRCFTCSKCNKRLDSTNYNQGNDELLCTGCYRKTCGPRVYGFVSGAVLPTALDIEHGPDRRASFSASSSSCSSPSVEGLPQHARTASVSTINRDDPQCCPSCGKRVFFAEEVKALKRKWHRLCFKCQNCSKSLEPGRCSEHEKRIYCSTCYGRMFGPRGYGYAGGNGSLLAADINSSRPTTPSYRENGGSQFQYSSVDYTQAAPYAHRNEVPDYSQEPEVFEASEPIRGTQEWTEAVFTVPSAVPPRPGPGYYAPPAPAYAPPGYATSYERNYYANEPNY